MLEQYGAALARNINIVGGRRARTRPGGWRGLVGLLLVLLGTFALSTAPVAAARAENTVHLVRISGTIDSGLAPYLSRALEEAEREGARAVILEIDTPGGRLDAVLRMRQALLDAEVRTIAFVNHEAFSAGALVAIAADEIYMTDGAVIGAATPVDGAGNTADEKTLSAVSGVFRATAEARGRDPRVAEAMVDPAVAIPGVVEPGRLLTLTDDQALSAVQGYSKGTVTDRQALLGATGLEGAAVREIGQSPAESLVRVLTEPALAGLLFMLGILLIVAEVLTSTFSGIGIAGAGLLGLFFWGHLLAGLAGWEGIALVVLGLALLAVEAFVIPGFGVAGVAGVGALLGGLFLSVTGQEIITRADLERGLSAVGVAALALVGGGAVLLLALPRLAQTRGLVLQATVGELAPAAMAAPPAARRWPLILRGNSADSAPPPLETQLEPAPGASLVGARGEALSELRPAGFALIDGQRVDVITRGDVIPRGARVEIIRDEGYRRVVRWLALDEREPVEI